MRKQKTKTRPAIELLDGEAQYMGDGVFVLTQRCEKNQPHNVVIQEADLRRLTEINTPSNVIQLDAHREASSDQPGETLLLDVTYLENNFVGLDQGYGRVVLSLENLLAILKPMLADRPDDFTNEA